jgi:hypothetical protein
LTVATPPERVKFFNPQLGFPAAKKITIVHDCAGVATTSIESETLSPKANQGGLCRLGCGEREGSAS